MMVKLFVVMITVLLVSGCSGTDDSLDGTPSPSESTTTPSGVLTWVGADGGYEAIVSGTLGIGSNGCFELDGYVLVLPPGSSALPDDQGVDVPGIGRILVGDSVSTAGGYVDDTTNMKTEGNRDCLPSKKGVEVAVVSS